MHGRSFLLSPLSHHHSMKIQHTTINSKNLSLSSSAGMLIMEKTGGVGNNKMIRKPLVQNSGIIKTFFVMAFCHCSVTLLCINVMFDLLFLGFPLFIFHKFGFVSKKNFFKLSSSLINWTTPIVYGIPMVFSGTQIFVDNIDILLSSKESDSLLLSNHGSRIDWMVAMLVGHLRQVGDHSTVACRVGFVCEALIQFMPFIGWYRKIVCNDIFVSRSFVKDEMTIKNNIKEFHQESEKNRMLFLSPEGVIVDHGEKDIMYIQACMEFAKSNDIKPFDYVLTPRYKGTKCLLSQVEKNNGPIVSVCLAFVRDGKLLNCKLLSPERVVPDIYDLNQGIAGSPVSIYIHLRTIQVDDKSAFDAKTVLLTEYAWKDSVLREWESRLRYPNNNTKQQQQQQHNRFSKLEVCRMAIVLNHILHVALIMMVSVVLSFGHVVFLIKICVAMFWCIATTHTIGWLANQSSMESVPFETGIKAAITFVSSFWRSARSRIAEE